LINKNWGSLYLAKYDKKEKKLPDFDKWESTVSGGYQFPNEENFIFLCFGFRQSSCFALYKTLLQIFMYLILQNILFLMVVWIAENRRIWLAPSQKKKSVWTNYSGHSPERSLMPFHQYNCLQQTTRSHLFSKPFTKMWQIVCHLLCIRPSIN